MWVVDVNFGTDCSFLGPQNVSVEFQLLVDDFTILKVSIDNKNSLFNEKLLD